MRAPIRTVPTTEQLLNTSILMLAQERLLRQARERKIEQLTAEVEKLRADLTALQVKVCRRENATRELILMERDVRLMRAREAQRDMTRPLN